MPKDNWKMPNRIERNYYSQMHKLFKPFFSITKNLTSAEDMMQALDNLMNSPIFHKNAEEVAKTMATLTWKDGAKNWKQAARKSSKGQMIYFHIRTEQERLDEVLEEIIQRNAKLIKTLPRSVSDDVVRYIQKRSTEGVRASQIASEIQKMFPKKTKANASLIARTETSKASTMLTQARSQDLGLHWYIWRSSEDSRVRSSHEFMDGVICNYNHPPSPELLIHEKSQGYYNAGEVFNCRCYAEPLIEYNQTSWPCKVYYNGKVQQMSLAQFKKIAEQEVA